MAKQIVVDIMPPNWGTATREKRATVLSMIEKSGVADVIQSSARTLKITVESGRRGGAEAIARYAASLCGSPVADTQEADILKALTELCCADNSCLFWPKEISRGMGTNGGCRCFRDLPFEYRQRATRLHQLYSELYQLRLAKLVAIKEEVDNEG